MSGVSFPLRVKAVTIDLDGTLLDTIPDLAAAANLMLSELDCPPLPESRIRTFVGKGIANLVERTLEAAAVGPVEPEKRRRGLELFDRHYVRWAQNMKRSVNVRWLSEAVSGDLEKQSVVVQNW